MNSMGLEEKRRARAQFEADQRLSRMPGGTLDRYAKCPAEKVDGTPCDNRAGHLTNHIGAGKCQAHGGNGRFEIMISTIMLMHGAARELDSTPWEVLLRAMRRAAGQASWYDMKIAHVEDDADIMPGGASYPWVLGSQLMWRDAARYAKMALDAGVAERITQSVEAEANVIFTLFSEFLREMKLPAELEEKARLIMRNQALALEAAGQLVGDVEDDTEDAELIE